MLANGNCTNGFHCFPGGQRGAMIVFEGLDRSGKTTQAKLLFDYLSRAGQDVGIQRFPDREEPVTGPAIDSFLRNAKCIAENREAIHLIFAANRWLLNSKMHQKLASGQHLILDRYSHSGIAYSLAKGIGRQWACQPEIGLLRPDLVLFFDVNSADVSSRSGFGQEAMERSDFQQLVYNNMDKLFDSTYWRRIDAARPVEEVHRAVVEEVMALLGKMQKAGESQLAVFSPEDFGL